MSAVLTPNPSITPKRLSPVEYVAGLPIEDQEAILFYLVKEIVRENGEFGWIPFDAPDGHLGSFLPAKGEQELFERRGPKLTAEERDEFQQRVRNPGKSLTTEELMAALREAEPAEGHTPE
jgi:hypothetical protein